MKDPPLMKSSHSSDAGLRRVPFSVVDEAVHLLETEAAPWSIQMELRVEGHLDESRLRAAVGQALAVHPMARARKVPSRPSLRRDQWEIPAEPDLDPVRVVQCRDDSELSSVRAKLQGLAVPLAESPPLRLWLARHPQGDVLMLNANHAAMDAFGALSLLQSVARSYTGAPDPSPGPDSLEARGLLTELGAAGLPARARRHMALAEKLRDVIASPARVAPEGANAEAGYGFNHVSLTPTQTQALVALDHDGTVNDVLLAALHMTIAAWNAHHGEPCGRIGVLVPANLRPPQWRHQVVGNFSLPARVWTGRHSRRHRLTALRALTAQTGRKKRHGMGTALIEVLGRSERFPLWAKQALVNMVPVVGNRFVDTAMLSNLGRVSDPPSFGPGAGRTVGLWFSPPARMPLGLTIGAVTVEDRLHLVFRHRHRLFDARAARLFAGRYVAELDLFLSEMLTGETPPERLAS